MNQNELRGVKQTMLSPFVQMGLRETNKKHILQLLNLNLDTVNYQDEEIVKLKDFLFSLYLSKNDVESFYGDLVITECLPEPNFIRKALIAVLAHFAAEVFRLESQHEKFAGHPNVDLSESRRHATYDSRANAVGRTFLVAELENLIMYGTVQKPRFNFAQLQESPCIFDVFVNNVPLESTFTEAYKGQLARELKSSTKGYTDLNSTSNPLDYDNRRSTDDRTKSLTRLRRSMRYLLNQEKYPKETWLKMVKKIMVLNFGEGDITDTMVLWSEFSYSAINLNEVPEIKVKIKDFGSEDESLVYSCPGDVRKYCQEKYEFEYQEYGISGKIEVFTRLTEGVKELSIYLTSDYAAGYSEFEKEIYADPSKKENSIERLVRLSSYSHLDKCWEPVLAANLSIELE